MRLQDYLEAQSLSYAEFARMIGVKKTDTVRRYATGERRPHKDLLPVIVEKTNGQVTPNDFFGVAA